MAGSFNDTIRHQLGIAPWAVILDNIETAGSCALDDFTGLNSDCGKKCARYTNLIGSNLWHNVSIT